jgi:hypothetical protein
MGWKNDGHPVPESNLAVDRNSGRPPTTET